MGQGVRASPKLSCSAKVGHPHGATLWSPAFSTVVDRLPTGRRERATTKGPPLRAGTAAQAGNDTAGLRTASTIASTKVSSIRWRAAAPAASATPRRPAARASRCSWTRVAARARGCVAGGERRAEFQAGPRLARPVADGTLTRDPEEIGRLIAAFDKAPARVTGMLRCPGISLPGTTAPPPANARRWMSAPRSRRTSPSDATPRRRQVPAAALSG